IGRNQTQFKLVAYVKCSRITHGEPGFNTNGAQIDIADSKGLKWRQTSIRRFGFKPLHSEGPQGATLRQGGGAHGSAAASRTRLLMREGGGVTVITNATAQPDHPVFG